MQTYLTTPADAPVVRVHDHKTGQTWGGVVHEGLVNDASGVLLPEDLGWRFSIFQDGQDITDTLC